MRIFCSNDRKSDIPDGYDDHIDISCRDDIGFHFWKKYIKFSREFSHLAIDLLYVSIFVYVIDRKILRKNQADNWCRTLYLNIPVSDIEFWDNNKNLLEEMVSFLSGDNWLFTFRKKEIFDEDEFYESNKYKKLAVKHYNTICMLSGGLDSYIGAIDLLEEGDHKVLFVSHYGGGKGTKEYQDLVFKSLKDKYGLEDLDYIQFYVTCKNGVEDTTRTRSFMFFAHAIALASAFDIESRIYIPENGFISLNIPLSGARFGSSSTRTTHPYYMKKLKILIKNMQLKLSIINPYQLKTKGEMILECRNKILLKNNYTKTMSCSHPDIGRYGKESETMHCGSCIPCIIRRAALLKGFGEDKTKVRDFYLTKTEAARLNKNALIQKIMKFNEKSSIFEIQKSGVIEENICELATMYCRGIKEIKKLLSEVIG